MLIRYHFNNFCSFYGDNEFSLETAVGKVRKRYPENYVDFANGTSCLKTAVIVGENAGGKSNFIESIRFLKDLFEDNAVICSVHPFINNVSLEKEEKPGQSFDITILGDNQLIYDYQLTINEKRICAEALYLQERKNRSKKLIFCVNWDAEKNRYEYEGKAGTSLKNLANSGKQGLGLFITKLALLGNEHAVAVTNWVNNSLIVDAINDRSDPDPRRLQSDLDILRDPRYTEIFRMVDYSITGIELDEEKPFSKTVVLRKDAQGNIMRRELQMDSAGVREFFAWAIQIYRVVYENKIVFADEMDRVLNPVLSDRVISYINGKENHGQFVFSTHNVLHLNLVTYMKEQIYFITKNKDTLISEIYSLSDFPEVRYQNTKIYEFYMKGILGGTASP